MESVQTIALLVLCGIKDCVFGGALALKFFWSTRNASQKNVPQATNKRNEGVKRTIFEVLMQCLGFGALYSFAIFAFDNYFLAYYIKYLTTFLSPDEDYYYWWFSAIFSFQFNASWTILLFLLSRILTYAWYQEVADLTYAKAGLKSTNQPSLSYALSDQINSALTQCFFLAQGYIVYLFPLPDLIKHVICVLHLSLLYSLYAFEYKWVQKGYSMDWRLAYVEAKWPYFVGFGLPLSILTFSVGSYIHSICIFSTIFPFYVMSSTITCASQLKIFNQPLKVFKLVTMASDFLVGGIINKILKAIR